MHLPSDGLDAKRVHLGIGEATIGKGAQMMETNLGSCLGIVIGWPEKGVYGMAHVLLPRRTSATDNRLARFGDTAVPLLLRRMRADSTAVRGRLSAVVSGGASMFTSTRNVGEQNQQEVIRALREAKVRVIGRDVGGETGRRLTVDCRTGEVWSEALSGEANVERWVIRERRRKAAQ